MPVLERERLSLQPTLKTEFSFARRPPAKLEASSGNDAFRLERYDVPINKDSLRDDVVSYLGEYRFALPKYSYKLIFENGHLLDPNKKYSLENMADKSIKTRLLDGKSIYREVAEKEGIRMLDVKLRTAKKGDTIIWMSPPGDKNEGYGDYGFVFYGRVGPSTDISMTAIRVNGEDSEKYNKALQMLTDVKSSYVKPEEFIANPQVLNDNLPEGYVDAILGLTLGFKDNKKENERFQNVMQALKPMIEDFIEKPSEKGLFSLENFALKLKKDYEGLQIGEQVIFSKDQQKDFRLRDIMGEYGHKPPAVAGSCGSSGKDNSITSSNILNKLSGINNVLSDSEQEWFHCPKCDFQADGPIGDTCPNCKLTKEEYAQETGIVCD